MRWLPLLLLAALLSCAGALGAQTVAVTVRLVYYDNGKPGKGFSVVLAEGDPQAHPSPHYLETKTDAEGIAVFTLSAPLPQRVYPYFDDDRLDACQWVPVIPLEEILARGFTISIDDHTGNYCKGDPQILEKVRPVPGEILIFIRKRSFFG